MPDQNNSHIQQVLGKIQPATKSLAEEHERYATPPTDSKAIPEFRESMKFRMQALGLAIHAAVQAGQSDPNATEEIAMIKYTLYHRFNPCHNRSSNQSRGSGSQ